MAAAGIDPADLGRLPPADVVILGEVHDNPQHHANQARGVASISPEALVFEMLAAGEISLAGVDRTDRAALARAVNWDAQGWGDFAAYHPILLAAPDARIFGADPGRAEARRAMTEGAALVFGPQAARFGLTTALSPADQATRETLQQEAHCGALPPDLLPGMVEAQRLRDAAFARAAIAAHDVTGGPVVVITGTGHADRTQGIPAALVAAREDLTVLSIGQLESDPGADAPYDLWIVTDPTPREDPCLAFRKP